MGKRKTVVMVDNLPDETETSETICKACGSNIRTAYTLVNSMEYLGKYIEWNRTRCQSCGQCRIDRSEREI